MAISTASFDRLQYAKIASGWERPGNEATRLLGELLTSRWTYTRSKAAATISFRRLSSAAGSPISDSVLSDTTVVRIQNSGPDTKR